MSSFSRSATYTFLTQIPTQIFGIISGIFITRMLGPEGKGVYAIFYADISLFITILGFSINTAIIHFLASKKLTEAKLLGISVYFSLLTIGLSLIVLFIWINLPIAELLFPSNHITWQYILWFCLFLTVTQINTVYSSFFQGARRFDIVNRVLFINSIFNLTLYGIAYLLNHFEVIDIGLYEVLLIALAVLLMNSFHWHKHYRKIFSYKFSLILKWKKDIKVFFDFMGVGHLSIIINFFNYRMVLWILAYYMDNEQVGIFSVAVGLSQLLYFISTPLSQVLMPFLSAEGEEKRKLMFSRFARIHFTVVLLLAGASLIIAPIFIPLLYGIEFESAVVAFEIIIFGILLSCQTKIFASYFVAIHKMKLNLYATIIGFLLTFIFNFTLIKTYGINGASLAQTITYTGIFLFVFLALVTFVKVGTWNLFIINKEDIIYAREKFKRKSNESD